MEKINELKPDIIELYSDGACSPNPGKGGCGYAIRYLDPKELDDSRSEQLISSGRGYADTTNNRMELMGCYVGLCQVETLLRCWLEGKAIVTLGDGEIIAGEADRQKIVNPIPFRRINVISDSSYLCRGFGNGWVKKWKLNRWLTSTGALVKNVDMWQAIDGRLATIKQRYGLAWHFICVPGHRGYKFNELCDRLAVAARKGELEMDDSPLGYIGEEY